MPKLRGCTAAKELLRNSSGEQDYLYNGKEFNEDLGLDWYDYGARYYDPSIGRWNAVDPLAEKFVAWSPYIYVLGNPISLVDPDGREPCDDPSSDCYSIAKGDTFWSIEKSRGWKHGTLQSLNGNIDPNKLQIGQYIKTPHHLANFSEELPGSPLVGSKKPEQIISINMFVKHFTGNSYKEIISEAGYTKFLIPNGPLPKYRYVFDPGNSKAVIDMRHMLVIGQTSKEIGDWVEKIQANRNNPSGNDPQDFYSNDLGYKFFGYLKNIAPVTTRPGIKEGFPSYSSSDIWALLEDKNFANYVHKFLTSPSLRKE